jgi:hypothetical protein
MKVTITQTKFWPYLMAYISIFITIFIIFT